MIKDLYEKIKIIWLNKIRIMGYDKNVNWDTLDDTLVDICMGEFSSYKRKQLMNKIKLREQELRLQIKKYSEYSDHYIKLKSRLLELNIVKRFINDIE